MLPPTGCAAFDRDFNVIFTIAIRQVSTAQELEAMLGELYGAILDIDFRAYDIGELRLQAASVMRATFDLPIALRRQLASWEMHGLFSKAAQKMLRDVFRACRYATDILGELAIGYDQMEKSDEIYRAFTGPHNNTFAIPEYSKDEQAVIFQSGDVLVTRGMVYNSAAIARIGDVDSQFSHVAMLHVDDQGRQRVLESLIEEGATVSNLDYTLEYGLARAVLYRHRDPDIAARAADRMFERIKASRLSGGRHISYNFTMELEDYTSLFCSQVIREGFERASGGLITLPTYPTEFYNAPHDFISRIGVTADVTFAPGDMELETQFVPIAEWRDFRKTSQVRLMDFIMVKLFEWMEKGYVFQPSLSIRAIGVAGKASGYLPNNFKNALLPLVPKVPSNMTASTIEAIAMLHKTAEPIYRRLYELERKAIKATDRPLHPRDIYDYLDAFERDARGKIGYLKLQ